MCNLIKEEISGNPCRGNAKRDRGQSCLRNIMTRFQRNKSLPVIPRLSEFILLLHPRSWLSTNQNVGTDLGSTTLPGELVEGMHDVF